MRNRLFDSIIQTSGADTDDIHSGEAEGNFWAENELFEAVLREAIIEVSIDEEKESHERHAPNDGFKWYYFGMSAEKINAMLDEYSAYFNKETEKDGFIIKYCSYKITDDKTEECIGWLNYLIFTDDDNSKFINNVKIKQEIPKSENDCLQQAVKHIINLIQNNSITSISWQARNDSKNIRIRQYSALCHRFGNIPKTYDDRIVFTISGESFIKNKDKIMEYFQLT